MKLLHHFYSTIGVRPLAALLRALHLPDARERPVRRRFRAQMGNGSAEHGHVRPHLLGEKNPCVAVDILGGFLYNCLHNLLVFVVICFNTNIIVKTLRFSMENSKNSGIKTQTREGQERTLTGLGLKCRFEFGVCHENKSNSSDSNMPKSRFWLPCGAVE